MHTGRRVNRVQRGLVGMASLALLQIREEVPCLYLLKASPQESGEMLDIPSGMQKQVTQCGLALHGCAYGAHPSLNDREGQRKVKEKVRLMKNMNTSL